jgi:hypothetical protein
MNNDFNPLLDEDDEITVAEAEVKAEPKGDGRPGSEFWGREKSPEKKAADAKLRAEGKVPAGQKAKQGERRDFTDRDFAVLEPMLHLDGGLITSHMAARLLGVGWRTAHGRLNGLKKKGFVDSIQLLNANMVWILKEAGVDLMRNSGINVPASYTLINPKKLAETKFAHTLAVNHVAVHLMTGGPSMVNFGKSIPVTQLITEKKLKRDFANAQFKKDTAFGAGTLAERAKGEAKGRLANGTLSYSELLKEYPMLWIPTTSSSSRVPAKQVSPPDLVLNREHLRTDKRRKSIAIEVELHDKEPIEYRQIMETYRQNDLVYTGVIWYVAKPEFQKKIQEAAEAVGYPAGRLLFSLITGKDGLPYSGTKCL